jgi:hypothetical protein
VFVLTLQSAGCDGLEGTEGALTDWLDWNSSKARQRFSKNVIRSANVGMSEHEAVKISQSRN